MKKSPNQRLQSRLPSSSLSSKTDSTWSFTPVASYLPARQNLGQAYHQEKVSSGAEVGGAWSCCLPCAGGGGGGGGAAVSGATPEAKKGSTGHKCQQQQQPCQQQQQQPLQEKQQDKSLQQHQQQQQLQAKKKVPVVQASELAPLSNLDEDLDDLDDEKAVELIRTEDEELGKEGGTQHRLSPRLHDIEEEDDEEGRNTKERPYQKKSPTPSSGGGSRTGWRSRRSITTAGAPAHQHHVIASAAATAQAKMQAEQGSIGELRGYHNLRSRRHTLANVR
ncbi:uncharacterized protein LOC143174264 [Nomia melanderi]|uniref:uncharacterized protein LOC143174264 n=1 Tax=Nomia melanderi TaxID=2448451 RepID=UPI003FCEDBF5